MHPLAKKHFEKVLKSSKILGPNKNCKYYPCHLNLKDCTWCYCPFYPCEDKTLGKYIEQKGKKIWSCENCAWIHCKNVAQEVLNKIKELGIEKPKEIEKYHQELIQIKERMRKHKFKNIKIAITGGKGGTGKSTVATALAIELSEKNKVLLIDADVDCPDDDIILSINLKKIKDVETMIPKVDKNKCRKCGKCSQVCRENAIIHIKGEFPILISEQCTGCKACKIACPVNAISEAKQKIGEIFIGEKGSITLISGKIKPGIEESSLIVNAIKKYIKQKQENYDYTIIDTAAGTHCPVIAALLDTDLGIAITEPTPLGNHDLTLILELMKKLKIKSKIVLNRNNISHKNKIIETAQKFNSKIIAEIPYSKKVQQAYSKGEPIKHKAIKKIVESLKNG